jgi:hypothetical protein
MARLLGSQNKTTIRREIARARAAQLMEKVDTLYALDALAVLQEVMAHFYFKAKTIKSMTEPDFDELDDAMKETGRWAEKVAAFKHAKIQAMRLATDPNAPVLPESMTLEELRESIMADIERLSQAGVISLPRASGVVPANGNGGESEGGNGGESDAVRRG